MQDNGEAEAGWFDSVVDLIATPPEWASRSRPGVHPSWRSWCRFSPPWGGVSGAYLPDPKHFKLFAAGILLYIGLKMIRDLVKKNSGKDNKAKPR